MTVTNEQASKLQTIAKGLRNLLAEAEEVVAMSEDMDGRMEVYGAVSKMADAIHAVEDLTAGYEVEEIEEATETPEAKTNEAKATADEIVALLEEAKTKAEKLEAETTTAGLSMVNNVKNPTVSMRIETNAKAAIYDARHLSSSLDLSVENMQGYINSLEECLSLYRKDQECWENQK